MKPSVLKLFGPRRLQPERGLHAGVAPAPDEDAFEAVPPAEAPAWHALVIGVDAYPNLKPQDQLGGCANDARAMRDFLVDRVRIPGERLACLVSPGDEATAATAANIRAAFAALRRDVKAGDRVVLYYACHGKRLYRDAADGTSTAYYGLAPTDVGADAVAGLILDREINHLLRALKAREASVTVIADTCHSGGSTRGASPTAGERHLPDVKLTEAAWEALASHHPALREAAGGGARGVGEAVSRHGATAGDDGDFVILAACEDHETAKEFPEARAGADGPPVSRGLLTLSLLEALEKVPAERVRTLRWMDFYESLVQTVADRVKTIGASSQRPALEGRREKAVFGGDWTPFEPGFTVRNRDGVLTIEGGKVAGLDEGAEVELYAPQTPSFDDATPVARATIEQASISWSTLRLLGDAKPGDVANGSRARLVQAAPDASRMLVRMSTTDVPDDLRDAAIAASEGLFEVARGAEAANVEVRRWRDDVPPDVWPSSEDDDGAEAWEGAGGGWVIVRGDLEPSPRRLPDAALTADDVIAYLPERGGPIGRLAADVKNARLGAALGGALAHYASYLRTRDRRSGDDALAAMVDVKLRGGPLPEGWQDEDPTGPVMQRAMGAMVEMSPDDGVYGVTEPHGFFVDLRVLKKTRFKLQLGVIVCSDDGNIPVEAIWPPAGQGRTFAVNEVIRVGMGEGRGETPLVPNARPDQTRSYWTLKAFACTTEDDTLIPFDQMAQGETVQEIIDAFFRPKGRGKIGASKKREQTSWRTWEFRIEVKSASAST